MTISWPLQAPKPSQIHPNTLPHHSKSISKNRFFQFFYKPKKSKNRPREPYSSLNQYLSFFGRKKMRRNHTLKHFFDGLNAFFDKKLFLELIGGLGKVFWAGLIRKSCSACIKGAYASISTKDRCLICMFYHVTIIKDP